MNRAFLSTSSQTHQPVAPVTPLALVCKPSSAIHDSTPPPLYTKFAMRAHFVASTQSSSSSFAAAADDDASDDDVARVDAVFIFIFIFIFVFILVVVAVAVAPRFARVVISRVADVRLASRARRVSRLAARSAARRRHIASHRVASRRPGRPASADRDARRDGRVRARGDDR
jgi:beta-lactamase regulating signal transducer with metallopeptidase domain